MTKLQETTIQIKKLFSLLEKVKKETLGADYKKRTEMKDLQTKIEDKIRLLQMEARNKI